MTTERCGLLASKCKCNKGCICIFLKNHQGPHRSACGTIWGDAPLVSPKGVRVGEPSGFNLQLPQNLIMSLQDAQNIVSSAARNGLHCPCCGQYAKIYNRKFNSGMARTLITFYKHHRKTPGWVHVLKEFGFGKSGATFVSGDYGKLAYWELLEASKLKKTDGNPKSGIHRITPLGISFVEKRVQIPRHCFIYNDRLLAVSDEKLFITEALGDDFNYDELMKA